MQVSMRGWSQGAACRTALAEPSVCANALTESQRRSAPNVWAFAFVFMLAIFGMSDARAQYGSTSDTCPFLNGREDSAPPPESFPWLDASLGADQRVELLMAALTVEEKVDLATGEPCGLYGFFNAPIPRLKIPALKMADGPAGVRIADLSVNGGLSTALPAPLALAATWDPTLAEEYGEVLGREAFLSGHNVLLGPTLDTVRTPYGGRGFETFGEDPFLQSEMGVPYIEAIQTHPVLANAKHLALYNQETNRLNGVDVIADERAMREIYLPAFEAAVQRADVGTVMCSFNKVNGIYQCEDRMTLQDILKDEFGFRGFVMSDFGATKSTVLAALAGLDQEQPGGTYFGDKLLEAVESGLVSMDELDDKARRVLRPMFQFKLFDEPVQIGPLPIEEDGKIARQIAEQGIVLLKNQENALPLDASGLGSILVVGADATNTTAQGGGSAQVDSVYSVSPLDGVRNAAGANVTITHVAGTDPVGPANVLPGGANAVPSSVLMPAGAAPGTHGLAASYWANTDFSGEPAATGITGQVSLSLGFMAFGLTPTSITGSLPAELTAAPFSARWSGTLTAPASGEYTFMLSSRGRASLFINGQPVINQTESHTPDDPSTGTVTLESGVEYQIQVDYIADDPSIGGGGGTVGGELLLSWTPPEGTVTPNITEAANAARDVDAVIVFARDFSTESLDRSSLALPNGQDQLIASLIAANPRTIVVLQTGGAVTMPWLDAAQAVVEAWYGGEEQGNAIAAVLFGTVDPSGKLPVTFPRSESETPTSASPAYYPGIDNTVVYHEGIFVGYRWYDQFKVAPLFPFGYGLSYTTFQFEGLEISGGGEAGDGTKAPVEVTFKVTNTGSRAGAEVAQVYVGTLPADVETPPRQLAGFEKVELAPGASTQVTLEIDPRSLSYFSDETGEWVTPPGAVDIFVGSSSRDIKLTGKTAASSGGSNDTGAPEPSSSTPSADTSTGR